MRRLTVLLMGVIVMTLASASIVDANGERAAGIFIDAAGNAIGAVEMTQAADGAVAIALSLRDTSAIAPGAHGIHFHAAGNCEGPDFMTAGAHFNPMGTQHGTRNPRGPHVGDLPNLTVAAIPGGTNGHEAHLTTAMVTLASGPISIFDADGTSLVIHAGPDDEMTDPSGNSGGRIACAVLTPSLPGALPAAGAGAEANRRAVWTRVLMLTILMLACTGVVCAIARHPAG